MDYQAAIVLLNQILIPDITDFTCRYYIPDMINYFTMPRKLTTALESQFCKLKTKKQKRNKLWHMFGLLHGPGNNPAIEMRNGTKVWLKCGLYWRRDERPTLERWNWRINYMQVWHRKTKFKELDTYFSIVNDIKRIHQYTCDKQNDRQLCTLTNRAIHRNSRDEPAVLVGHAISIWANHGIIHRPVEHGVAIRMSHGYLQNSIFNFKAFVRKGYFHNEQGAWAVKFNTFRLSWYDNGVLLRTDY